MVGFAEVSVYGCKENLDLCRMGHTFKKNSGCNEIISVDRHCKRRSDSSVHPSLAFALWHLPPIVWIENSRTIFGGEESASEPFHAEERCRYICTLSNKSAQLAP